MRVLLLLCGLLAACAPAGPGESPWAPPVGGKADAYLPLAPGNHLLTLRSTTRFRDPKSGEEWDLTTRVTALATARYEDQEAVLSLQPCRVTLPQLNGYQPWLPEETVAAVPPVSASLFAVDVDGDEGEPTRFATGPSTITLGLDLQDPIGDPLPTDPDDPAVLDQDADGSPGVTVRVALFKIYLALRLTVALEGDDRGGNAQLGLERTILGDNIPFYDAAEAAAEAQDDNELVWASHTFDLSPTEALTCAELSELSE